MEPHVFRKGDTVSIEGVIEYVGAGSGQAKINVGDKYTSIFVDTGSLHLLTPAFNSGERVIHVGDVEEGYGPGEVIAIHGDMVWLKLDAKGLSTLPAKELVLEPRRVPIDNDLAEAEEPLTPPEMPVVEP